jgi:peptidoglycan/xylan/chitin deacetylase (PgdA/CDA1 family)
MQRRRFLMLVAAGLVGTAVSGDTVGPVDPEHHAPPRARPVTTAEPVVPAVEPPAGVVDRLPGTGTRLALTIDDGTSSEVVAAFCTLAVATGIRLTFFPNGCYRSWEKNGQLLQPLIDAGQVAMGNHTWSHPDLTTLGDDQVAEEIGRNRDWLDSTFGVRDTPFFRPPYGARDERTDRIAAEQGHPTIAMWQGTLADHRVLSGDELMAAARRSCSAQAIVLGHANQFAVATVFDRLLALIDARRLQTVTLADVWHRPELDGPPP